MMGDGFAAVARFDDTERAERFRSLLADHGVRSLLDGDGYTSPLTVSVDPADESQALDLAVTLVVGIDTDRMHPTPRYKRLLRPENWLFVAAGLTIVAAVALVVWWVSGVARFVHLGAVLTIVVMAAFNAFRPGKWGRARRRRLGGGD
ncbi:MAG TPA: hypothetical protein VMM81_06505 [Acidimicrobiia bacterium]|nr:hypothetical protein [Acidimicrobiia bacterium]